MNQEMIVRITNKRVILTSILLIIMSYIGYLREYISGARSLGYVLLLCLLITIPIIIALIFYRLPAYVMKFKSIALYSFLVTWMFMLLLSPKVIQYALIFPLMMIYLLYFDAKLMRNASLIMVAFSFIKVFLNIYYYEMSDEFIRTEYTVFIFSLIVFAVTTISTTKFSGVIQKNQLASIMDEKQKNEALLSEIMDMLGILENTSSSVGSIYVKLIIASDETRNSISALNYGMQEIAENLESQNSNTEKIHHHMEESAALSNSAMDSAALTTQSIQNGKTAIDNLNESAISVNSNNSNVHDKMIELQRNTDEIKNIISLIQAIARQTNLLALNASIESARAGEAGKGFAVVAESIRQLAQQTADALGHISNLVSTLETSANESITAAEASIADGNRQVSLIHETQTIFETIYGSVQEVNANVTFTSQKNQAIVDENQKIVEGIHSINKVVHTAASNSEKASELVNTNARLTSEAMEHMNQLAGVMNRIALIAK